MHVDYLPYILWCSSLPTILMMWHFISLLLLCACVCFCKEIRKWMSSRQPRSCVRGQTGKCLLSGCQDVPALHDMLSIIHPISTVFVQLWISSSTAYTLYPNPNPKLSFIRWPHVWNHFYAVYVHFTSTFNLYTKVTYTVTLLPLLAAVMYPSYIHWTCWWGATQRAEPLPSPDIEVFWKWLATYGNQKSINMVMFVPLHASIMGHEYTPAVQC